MRPPIYDDVEVRLLEFEEQRHPETGATVAFLKSLVPTGGRIMEIGSGCGRLVIPLASEGVDVLAVERSARAASVLRAKRDALGLSSLSVLAGDASELSAGQRFDLVFMVWNTLLYATSEDAQRDLLSLAHSHVARGGCCVVETGVPDLDGDMAGLPMLGIHAMTTNAAEVTLTQVLNDDQKFLRHRLWLSDRGMGFLPLTLRYLLPDQLRELALAVGFSQVEQYADWAGSPAHGADRTVSKFSRS